MTKTEELNTIPAQILRECLQIHSERHVQYGASEDNFGNIAAIATRLSSDNKQVTALDVAMGYLQSSHSSYVAMGYIQSSHSSYVAVGYVQSHSVLQVLFYLYPQLLRRNGLY